MKNIYRKLINNIGAVILIAILGFILMGATYVNLGPTSLIDGDIGVTAGHGYYIDGVSIGGINYQNWIDSPCVVTGGVVSEGTNAGTFKVTAITAALLRATASVTGVLTSVTLAEQDNQELAAADTTYYVIFTYGSPCTITTAVAGPNGYNAISLGRVMKDGSNNVYYISGGFRLGDGVAKLWKRAKALRAIELMNGNAIAYSGTNNFTMTEGHVYAGGNNITQAAYNSASTTFTPVYTGFVEGNLLSGTDIAFVDGGAGEDTITRVAADFVTNGYVVGDVLTVAGATNGGNNSSFTLTGVTAGVLNVATGSLIAEAAGASVTLTVAKYKIDFAHYDNAGTLTAIANNKYGCHWVYRHVDDGGVYVRYGTGSYTLAEAQAVGEPSKPTHLTDFGGLIGKIIAPQAGGSFTTILMVTDRIFTGAAVSDHANLSNLDYASAGHTGFIGDSIGTAQGDLIYFTASATPTVLPKGTASQVLTMNAGATAPEWAAGGGGYTDLTSFVDQTAWRVFYSNTDGDVTELALGADGEYLMSNGAAVAPTFETPAGGGDMLKATYDADEDDEIDVAGGGTEKASWTQYCIPYLSNTTIFGEIPIGTAEYALTVAAGATGYDWTLFDLSLYYLKTEIDTQGEVETIWGDTLMNDLVDDTTPELGGELDAGAHTIGFTQQSTTGDGTTTIDWKLGNKFKFTFGAQNDTFTFTAPTNPCNILLMLIQDGTGSRTATWPGTVKWAGGAAPTLTTGANTIDICSFYWDGTDYFGVASLAFATP